MLAFPGAASCFAFLHGVRINDNLALHSPVPEATGMAALESVCTGSLSEELDRCSLSLLKLPTFFRRDKEQPRFAARFGAVGNGCDLEAMVVVCGRDFELNFAAGLNMNRRGRILVLLRCEFDDLRVLVLCLDWSRLQKTKSKCQGKCR